MAVTRRKALQTMAAVGAAAAVPAAVKASPLVPKIRALPPQPAQWQGQNAALSRYYRAAGYPTYAPHPRYLGVLQGNWEQIGRQYGERAGDLIRLVYEGWYRELLPIQGNVAAMTGYLKQQRAYYEMLVPEALELMQGIALGAAADLRASAFAAELSDADKILMINSYFGLQGRPPRGETAELAPEEEDTHCCSGAVMLPAATAEGQTIHCSSEDQHFFPQEYLVTFVAQPSDPRAHRYTITDSAGEIGSEHALNQRGVSVSGYAGGGDKILAPTLSRPFSGYRRPGLDWQVGNFFAAAFAASAADAVSLLTRGRPEYRKQSGLEIVVGKCTRGANWVVADRSSAFVVESIPADQNGMPRYAVRKPGDLGERGAAFVASCNNVEAHDSYDAHNRHDPAHPMRQHGDARAGQPQHQYFGLNTSGTRFWTFTWLIQNNFGRITPEMVQGWRRTHFMYDEAGKRHDTVEVEGKPIVPALAPGSGTLCRHTTSAPGVESYKGVNIYVSLSLPGELKCLRTKGRPCEWQGPWDQMQL
ncbi:MAG: hypothetical protein ACRD2D_01475 [Terriglobales bacterium]